MEQSCSRYFLKGKLPKKAVGAPAVSARRLNTGLQQSLALLSAVPEKWDAVLVGWEGRMNYLHACEPLQHIMQVVGTVLCTWLGTNIFWRWAELALWLNNCLECWARAQPGRVPVPALCPRQHFWSMKWSLRKLGTGSARSTTVGISNICVGAHWPNLYLCRAYSECISSTFELPLRAIVKFPVTNLKAVTPLLDDVQMFLKSLGRMTNSWSSVRTFYWKTVYSWMGLWGAFLFRGGMWHSRMEMLLLKGNFPNHLLSLKHTVGTRSWLVSVLRCVALSRWSCLLEQSSFYCGWAFCYRMEIIILKTLRRVCL